MTTFSQFSDYQDPDARPKQKCFAIKRNRTSVKFSVEVLVKERKLVLTSEEEFEGDKSNYTASFGILGLSPFLTGEQNDLFFKETIF